MSRFLLASILLTLATACGDGGGSAYPQPKNPDTSPMAMVDRFSSAAGMLMVRGAGNNLPAAGAAIDFDQPPFVTAGLGTDGRHVSYYNFDVRPNTPANIYVLFAEGATTPFPGQLNIVDTIPGDPGYNDLWRVVRVDVPTDYVANAVTSADEMKQQGWTMTPTDMLVNCPIVPAGSVARHRVGGGDAGLVRGWYKDEVVQYFNFAEAPLHVAGTSLVPVTPIFVSFNINPDKPGGGPPSGFLTEPGTMQTHNVIGALPGDAGYSPLWSVQVYDNADFASVKDLATAGAAHIIGTNVATVNCPLATEGS
jgi:hypothetical protein